MQSSTRQCKLPVNFSTNSTSGDSLLRLTCIEHQIWSLPSLFWPQFYSWCQFLAPAKNCCFLRFFMRECGSTLYIGLQHAVLPTNTKLKPLLLPTQTGMPYTNTHKQRTSYFKSTLTFLGPAKLWKPFRSPIKTGILAVLLHNNNKI